MARHDNLCELQVGSLRFLSSSANPDRCHHKKISYWTLSDVALHFTHRKHAIHPNTKRLISMKFQTQILLLIAIIAPFALARIRGSDRDAREFGRILGIGGFEDSGKKIKAAKSGKEEKASKSEKSTKDSKSEKSGKSEKEKKSTDKSKKSSDKMEKEDKARRG